MDAVNKARKYWKDDFNIEDTEKPSKQKTNEKLRQMYLTQDSLHLVSLSTVDAIERRLVELQAISRVTGSRWPVGMRRDVRIIHGAEMPYDDRYVLRSWKGEIQSPVVREKPDVFAIV